MEYFYIASGMAQPKDSSMLCRVLTLIGMSLKRENPIALASAEVRVKLKGNSISLCLAQPNRQLVSLTGHSKTKTECVLRTHPKKESTTDHRFSTRIGQTVTLMQTQKVVSMECLTVNLTATKMEHSNASMYCRHQLTRLALQTSIHS